MVAALVDIDDEIAEADPLRLAESFKRFINDGGLGDSESVQGGQAEYWAPQLRSPLKVWT
ncbi:hypothetical protein [Sinorhizobium meliloti]|nr:hypothetical protein U8C39_05675 [Sinorhizobium meliloti]WQP16698.1 hypothetical protein U8C33_01380 [Sinorhizobium meliloti]WQP29659.1 hypothetical protein U8C45_05655 [Sinorhizobium meliloti]